MSRVIDERIVSMQFDNKRFEQNVSTTMGTLDKLKKSLNLDGASKGLENISTAAKGISFNPLGSAVDSVKVKFSALQVVGITALSNIANQAVNTGKRVLSSLTIDPVKTGLNEYETQIGAIQTILANTQSKGTNLSQVNAALDELNRYADKTIYNFTEMTRNIGTFTAAGVGLNESVSAIKGIANLAAISGSTSQQASTAMYQLSQALATGTVKLMDWNSVVNAGMGGEVFQTALKRTATQMGYNVDAMIEKYGSFRESLTKGEWLTAEVLTETLAQLAGAYSEADLIAQGYTDKQAKEIVELAKTAESAATDVKTFTQLIDTLKETAQSGWTQTWEYLIGDFEQAKELWSGVSKVLGGLIDGMSASRNELLGGALQSNWDKLIKKINEGGVETSAFEEATKKALNDKGYNADALIKNYGSLAEVFRSGAASAEILKEVLNGLTKSGKALDEIDFSSITDPLKLTMTGDNVKKLEKALVDLGYSLTGKDGKFYGDDGYFGTLTRDAVKAFQKAQGLKITGIVDKATLDALKKAHSELSALNKAALEIDETFTELIDGISELGGRELLIESFKNAWKGLEKIFGSVKTAWDEVFDKLTPDQLYSGIESFHEFSKNLIISDENAEKLTKTFKGLFTVLKTVGGFIAKVAGVGFKVLTKVLGVVGNGVLTFTSSIGESIATIKNWIQAFFELPAVQKSLSRVSEEFGKFKKVVSDRWSGGVKVFGDFVKRLKDLDSISLDSIGSVFTDFKDNVIGYFINTDTGTIFDGFIKAIKGFGSKVATYLESAGIKFDEIKTKIVSFVTTVKENIQNNLGGILALGALVSMFLMFKKIKDTVELIAKPFEFIDELGKGLKSLGNALKLSIKASAVKNIALSIAILAGSVAVLAMLPYGRLWSAVGAIAVMGGVLAGVILVLSKVSDNLGDLAKLSVAILTLAGSMLVLGLAAKIISGIDAGGLGKVALVLAGFIGMLALLSKASKMVISPSSIAAFGTTMIALGGALLLMSVAIGILGSMDVKTLTQGMAAITVFLAEMAGMMVATRGLAKSIPRFGTMMAGLAAALLIFSVSIGILGNMDTATLAQGGAAITVFLLEMVAMMAATKLLTRDIPRFGSTMMGLSVGLLAMAYTAKIIAGINSGDLVKGGIVIAAFLAMMAGMMKATQLLTKNSANAAKLGAMILSFAASMILLTGAIAILSLLDIGKIAKGITAIALIGGIFAGMIALTKFAKVGKGVKTTIITMAAAIGVLAISVAALSFVDPSKLASATAALSAIMAMFSILAVSTKFMGTKGIGMLLVMAGVVALLGFILRSLSDIPVDSALGVATALSELILALSASCLLLGAVGAIGPMAFIGVGVLAALLAVIALFAGIAIASLPKIGEQLSKFMENLKPFLDGVSGIDSNVANGIKALSEALLILTGSSLLNQLGSAFGFGKSPLEGFGDGIKTFGKDLATFLSDIGEVTNSLAGTGSQGTIFWDNIEKSVNTAVKLSEIAGTIPDTSGWSTLFSKKDLGAFGDQIASFASGLGTYLATVGGKFTALNSAGEVEEVTVDWDNVDKAAGVAAKLAELAATIPDTSGWSTLFSKKDLGVFGDQIAYFASSLSTYLTAVGGKFTALNAAGEVEDVTVNWDNVKKATDIASDLADLATDIPDTSGWGAIFSAKDLGAFGDQIASFASSLSTYLTTVGGKFTALNAAGEVEDVTVNWDNVKKATDIAVSLKDVASEIPDTSGWSTIFSAKDLGSFGDQIASFASSLSTYLAKVGGKFTALNAAGEVEEVTVNWGNITKATNVAKDLSAVAVSIPDTSGWSTIFSAKDLGSFGDQIASFASSLSTYLTTVGGKFAALNAAGEVEEVTVNWDNITKAADVAVKLAGIAETIPDTEGWSTIFGKKDLGSFGEQVSTFATGISSFVTSINTAFSSMASDITIDFTMIDSVVDVANKLAEMAGTVGANSEGWEWLTGKDGLDAFGSKIENLGTQLAAFCSAVSGKDFDVSSISSAITEIEKFVGMAERLSGDKIGDLYDFGLQIQSLGFGVSNFYAHISDIDASKFSSVANGLSDLASINVTNADSLQSFIDSLGDVGTDGVDAFADAFKNSAPKVLASVSTMMSMVQTTIKTKGIEVTNAVSDVVKNASKIASNFSVISGFFSAGVAMAQGLAAGISAGKIIVVSSAVAMAQAALTAAKEALGINSPAKEFIPVGGAVPEGFAKGVDKFGSMVTSSVTSMAENALDGTKNAIARMARVIDSNIDAQPVIRPVLDLSAVTAGAGSINDMLNLNPSVGVMSNIGAISSMMNNNQNGANDDVVSAIKDLGSKLGNSSSGDMYNINGITYDDGSNITEAVKTLVRAARIERRV